MKRALLLATIFALAFGSVAIFAIDDSRAVPYPSQKPICRTASPSAGKCLVWVYSGGVVYAQRLETLRKNIYWKSASPPARDPAVFPRHLPHSGPSGGP